MPASTLTEFHHWLLADDPPGAPFLTLHVTDGNFGHLAGAIARHLNEFDEGSGGNWIALSADTVDTIAADPAQRRLLGLPETGPDGIRTVLAELARRGHVVVDHPLALEVAKDDANAFRAAIGMPGDDLGPFHLIVNPARFHPRCLAPLIADSFLEWIVSRTPEARAVG